MSSQNLETDTKQTTMQTNSAFSTAVDNNNIFVTSITPTTTREMKSSLLTSSDNVSNTPTITSTSTNNIIDITSTQEVFEDNLSSTSDTVHQTTNLEVVSTDFDIQSTITSSSTVLSTRADTTINQDKSTVSHNVTELISTSAESSLSEQITTYT
ncbi:unnamed protein product, partial [Rotaria sordida]